jgi:hypothetical protein
MDSYSWAQIITLGLAIAVLVILIVVLTRNNLTATNNLIVENAAAAGATYNADNLKNTANAVQASMIKEDNKVNWLYGLAIAEAGIVVVFGVLTLLAMVRWSKMVKA